MIKFAKKLSAMTLCTMFASMQIASAAIDTGLNNAVINNTQGGFAGIETGQNSATLNFNGNTHVNWDSLNVGNGETLNFNAVNGASGLTVLNTVNSGMSHIYGTINSNSGISKLVISNPNGMIYDGAKFTTAGDLMLTTQALGANIVDGNIEIFGIAEEATNGIVIKNSDFSVGGEFNITAPSVEIIKTLIKPGRSLKLVTQNGQDYLLCPTTSNDTDHVAVRMESVSVDGNVYILSAKDLVKIVNGGKIDGNLDINTDGNVALNFVNNGEKFTVTKDLKVVNDGRISYLRNANVGGNIDMSNSGGFLEIADVKADGDVNLTTTVKTNSAVKHFVHVVGDNDIKGNLNVDSAHNVHIGGYKSDLETIAKGGLKVGKDLNVNAREGSIAVTVDTTADKVNLESGTLNIISDGKAVIKANDYKLKAEHYIGSIANDDTIIETMENYLPITNEESYLQIGGGNVSKLVTGKDGKAYVRANDSITVNGVNANTVNLSSVKDIKIGKDAKANTITVDGETRNLTVETPSRDYTLKYTNIKDTKELTIDGKTEITYEMANGINGWNKGIQTKENTYLVVPGEPVVPPVDPVIPPTEPTEYQGQDNDNVKILNNLVKDQVASAMDAQQVYTPVAFAADLDDEIDTGVRKNVDGSVTVVRAYTPSNK